jgi:hypothetical protein
LRHMSRLFLLSYMMLDRFGGKLKRYVYFKLFRRSQRLIFPVMLRLARDAIRCL